ncbi:hypothetical protein [Aquipuribacter sp. MA13-6]|uniref:hypothetical protein n=1 Tax=unclassified Aquipuribacter TaxID=2635084 RepID=UPI003EEB1B8F
MYPPPDGKHLTAEQARELDDTFLASDPFQYFSSRIASLLAWHERAGAGEPLPAPEPGSIRAELNQYLHRPVVAGPFRALDVHAQVAADALAVRHHAAEALLRLACARLAPDSKMGAPSLWAEIACGPKQTADVVKRLNASAERPGAGEHVFCALVEPEERETARSNSEVVDACNVFVDWLHYAATLLSTGVPIDLQAGHNKVKHGLAVRARSDMRLVSLPTGPDADGTIPLSAFTGPGVVDIFDQPVLEVLAQPKVAGHLQGLEVTQLRLKPSALLADAYMLAMTHGAMFHVAAVEHFTGRDDLREDMTPPASPGYPVGGPRPSSIDASAPLGMRFPLTTPPGGREGQREAGIGFRDHFRVLHIDHAGRGQGHVVQD